MDTFVLQDFYEHNPLFNTLVGYDLSWKETWGKRRTFHVTRTSHPNLDNNTTFSQPSTTTQHLISGLLKSLIICYSGSIKFLYYTLSHI